MKKKLNAKNMTWIVTEQLEALRDTPPVVREVVAEAIQMRQRRIERYREALAVYCEIGATQASRAQRMMDNAIGARLKLDALKAELAGLTLWADAHVPQEE